MLSRLRHKHASILLSCTEEKSYKIDAAWEFHSLMRILSGEMKISLGEESQTFVAGDTFLVPRNQMSTVIKRAKGDIQFSSILVRFRPEHLKDYFARNKIKAKHSSKQRVRAYHHHPLLDSFFASLIPYFDLEKKLPDELTAIKINEILTILREVDESVDGLLADYSVTDKIDLSLFMETNFMRNMPLEKFAFLSGRSISTFNRDFRAIFNAAPQKWLISRRLEFAHYQLAVEKKKPNEIYPEIGFKNFSHFSFSFKKLFGYSPGTFSGMKEKPGPSQL